MFKLAFLAVLIVASTSAQLSTVILTQRGAGISAAQETVILALSKKAYESDPSYPYGNCLSIKDNIESQYGQFWVVQIMEGYDGFKSGRSNIKSDKEQWISYSFEGTGWNYWIWVPQSNGASSISQSQYWAALKDSTFEPNLKNLKQRGMGITSGQEVAINKVMDNAVLSKKDDLTANAILIEQKLQDSYGQNWIVEIYDGANGWGRAGLAFDNDQWIWYQYYGDNLWHYLIWVPGY